MKQVKRGKGNNGIATLAVVASIALITLLMVFGVSRRVVNDIQQAQARIKTERSLSKAWAALDCAVAKIYQDGLDLSSGDATEGLKQLSECQGVANSRLQLARWQNNPSLWRLSAHSKHQQVGVTLQGAGGGKAAAFVTSGSVLFYGANVWRPAEGKKREDGRYECQSIIAGGDVLISPKKPGEPDKSNQENQKNGSKNTFTVHLEEGKECADEYKTKVDYGEVADSRDETRKLLKKDVKTNVEGMDVFQDYFGVPRSRWPIAKEQFIDQGGVAVDTHGDASKCFDTLVEAVGQGQSNVKVWVNGPCDLSRGGKLPLANDSPILLVVQDGIMALRGAMNPFNGVIYQFNPTLNANEFARQWGMDSSQSGQLSCTHSDATIRELCQNITANVKKPQQASRVPFWFDGSFKTNGAFIIDVPDGNTLVNSSLVANYDDGNKSASFEGLGQLRPLPNSYYNLTPPSGG
ncbi:MULTISPECIES: hypothetical protein [unclassified Salinivibrio]|uniref:hypothetical protein n=1 Tax=unclassified Salinivibrio TaxID=2636825 RepID=UPI00128D54EA|nr:MULTISPECIES: hypothetical protein [unclassified Salinivibrio]MPS33513.1 hypothetical protein [Salinivibrio sp. VYel7]MPX94897.1 hypothetical protein [Salinivibrio sp. VYel9]MPX97895.1 hypothetical protein [Salinivibrio sp. VYel6]MPY01127.1 hypothetical protein [Salinivibrio sp. VYel4]MPY04203.1 hypothetical protein [Salinivibrio sp. VYel5]